MGTAKARNIGLASAKIGKARQSVFASRKNSGQRADAPPPPPTSNIAVGPRITFGLPRNWGSRLPANRTSKSK
jgi:hypothetical protein